MIGLKRGTVQVVSYQPSWKVLFEEEAERLRASPGNRVLQIEHFGSTAIEGMHAKPIIDNLAAVENLNKTRELVTVVEALGYEYKTDDSVPNRVFFGKGPSSKQTHHLSLAEPTSVYRVAHILFSDYLRRHPEAAEEYRTLKREMANRYPDDRDLYTDGKKRFVEKVLELARNKATKDED